MAHQNGSVDLYLPECVPGYHVNHIQGQAECAYCLCKPCITDERNRQLWWAAESQELIATTTRDVKMFRKILDSVVSQECVE